MNMNNVLIGPLPPPIGGITNHISRYSEKYKVEVINEKLILQKRIIFRILRLKKTNIHVHSDNWFICLLLLIKTYILKRKCEYYFYNHNFSISSYYLPGIKKKIEHLCRLFFIRECKNIFVVNSDLIIQMKDMYGELSYEIFDPFVAPNEMREDAIIKSYSPELSHFMNNHNLIITSGAWELSFYKGVDLYGFDLLIEMMGLLKKYFSSIGLIFFIGNPEHNKEYLLQYEDRIKNLCVNSFIHIEKGQKEQWPIIKKSDLYIRATNTDGDPLSIKEALYFGVPVLASDCTNRAKEVDIFANRDIESLVKNVHDIIQRVYHSKENKAVL